MNLKTSSKFFSLLKIVFFIAVCFVVGFAIIFPLWMFASKTPQVYSYFVIVFAALLVLRKIIISAKNSGVKKTVRIVLKAVIVATAIAICFYFLLKFERLFALLSIIAAIPLFKTTDLLREKK